MAELKEDRGAPWRFFGLATLVLGGVALLPGVVAMVLIKPIKETVVERKFAPNGRVSAALVKIEEGLMGEAWHLIEVKGVRSLWGPRTVAAGSTLWPREALRFAWRGQSLVISTPHGASRPHSTGDVFVDGRRIPVIYENH